MNNESEKHLQDINKLEKKLTGEDKIIFAKTMFLFDECARMQIIPEINTVTPTIARTANHFVARDMYIFICYPPRQIGICQ